MNRPSFPAPAPRATPRKLARSLFAVLFSLTPLAAGPAAPPASAAQKNRAQPRRQRDAAKRTTTTRSRTRPAGQRREAGKGIESPIYEPSIGEADGYEEKDNHLGRKEWFMMQRTYPAGEVPANARRAAWESRPTAKLKGDGARPIPQADAFRWQSIGPAPSTPQFPANWGLTSGRLNAVAVNPSNPLVVLIGASTGGIWRSADGGVTFKSTTDSHVDLAVGAIAFAPSDTNVVYAAMGDNDNGYLGTGLLKSTDGGQTWAQAARLLGSPGCPDTFSPGCLPALGRSTAVAVDPTDANRVYLAQYVYYNGNPNGSIFSNGLYVSTDGGVNWTKRLAGLVRNVVQHPTNPNVLYAGLNRKDPDANPTGPAGVYKSVDKGQTWTNIFGTPFNTTFEMCVAVTPAAPENVYVFGGGAIAGQTGTQLRIEVSADGGQTWTSKGAAGVDPGQMGYNSYIAVHPSNLNVVYVATRDVFRATDFARTDGVNPTFANVTLNFHAPSWGYNPFQAKAHPDQHAFAFMPGNPTTIYIGNDGGLYRSVDGGTNFQNLNASLALTQFVGVTAHTTNPNISYGGTQDNGTQVRTASTSGGALDSGPTNTRWREFSSGDGGRSVVIPTDPNMVFTTYITGTINRHTNSGATYNGGIGDNRVGGPVFKNSVTGAADRIAFYPPFVGNGADQTIYFGTHRLWVSTDLGTSWTPVGTPSDTGALDLAGGSTLSAIGVHRSPYGQIGSSTQTIYTGSANGRVFVTTDGGAAWTDRTAGLPNRFVEWITVDPANPAVAYVSFGGFGTGHVWKTTSHGAGWADISGTAGAGGLPNTPVSALLIDPSDPNLLYAGTDVGVFRSTTSGVTWETFNNGMPPAVVTSFTVNAAGKIQASTYGRGAYQLGETDAATLQFSFVNQTASEADGGAYVVVRRSGNMSAVVSVDVRTADNNSFNPCNPATLRPDGTPYPQGVAYPRCDYSTTIETLTFGPGEIAKSVRVPLIDDVYVEPNENVQLALSNPSAGAQIGPFGTTALIITSADAAGQPNPVDTHGFFVRQQYIDFLSREPEQAGLNAWLGVLNGCPNAYNTDPNNAAAQCDRNLVSSSFFRSAEFELKGGHVFRYYRLTYGRLPQYTEIVADMASVTGATQQEVFQKKAAFATNWVNSAGFQTAHGATTNQQLVDQLMDKYALSSIRTPDPAAPDGDARIVLTRAELVARLNAATLTRPQLVRAIVDSDEVSNAEFRPAFVAMQYFGYLRRDPETAGYNAWLNYLNANPADFYTMVNGFANSGEYRLRFGAQ